MHYANLRPQWLHTRASSCTGKVQSLHIRMFSKPIGNAVNASSANGGDKMRDKKNQ